MRFAPHLVPDPAGAPRPSAKVATVAGMLDCDESEVRRMVREGDLEAHRKGKRGIRVFLDSVTRYQAARAVSPAKAAQSLTIQRHAASRAGAAAADAVLRNTRILT